VLCGRMGGRFDAVILGLLDVRSTSPMATAVVPIDAFSAAVTAGDDREGKAEQGKKRCDFHGRSLTSNRVSSGAADRIRLG
jgi:hypothetical protein